MKKSIFAFIIIINTIFYSQCGFTTNLVSQYVLNTPNYNHQLIKRKTNTLPITITANNIQVNYPDSAIFTKNVNLSQGNSHLQADKIKLNQKKTNNTSEPIRTIDASGNVLFDDNQIILKGLKAWSNLNTKDINVWKGDYQMVGRQGYGKADLIKQRCENRFTILENGSFTSCLPNTNAWSITGSKLIYDREKQIIKIQNAYFKLGSIPIFYSPYLYLPIGDKRRSGFLIPNIKYNTKNYLEFYLPYYWNISANIDATITPHYFYKKGSFLWESEFRYLNKMGIGLIEFYYLPSDNFYHLNYSINNSKHRWLCHWQHSGVLNRVWHININYNTLNNVYYFNDFLLKNNSNINGYNNQMFHIDYATHHFDVAISTHQFNVFNGQIIDNYGTKPQLDFNWYQNNIGPFDMRFSGQLVYFVNTNSNMLETTRVHLEPSINLPWSNYWANLNTEVKLMTTHYKQKKPNNDNTIHNLHYKESINRVLPQFKMHGKFIFERDINFRKFYTQTLEPRIQYLYVPYCNQSKIKNYDSSILQFEYIDLFRERTYGGIDRIASANQIATGITSRIFDKNATERFNVSIGQIYFFTESHTGDNNSQMRKNNKTGSLIWSSNTYWHITNHWGIRGDIQYDLHLEDITTSNAAIEYNHNKNRIIKIGYRYANPTYIQTMLPGSAMTEPYNQGISQIGGISSWPISDNLSIIVAYYFDTNTHRVTNQQLGLQYNSCCYAIHIGCERKPNTWNKNSNHISYNSTINFNIELRGLYSNSNLIPQHMLHSNIL